MSFLLLPIGIADIVLSFKEKSCDTTDSIGLDVSKYLLGEGISSIATFVLIVINISLEYVHREEDLSMLGAYIIMIINGLFSISWFIVGAIILFRSNIDCIKTGGSSIIYALVIWCIMIFKLIVNKSVADSAVISV
jgi:hypothetical protein